jgi:hypothetical protein
MISDPDTGQAFRSKRRKRRVGIIALSVIFGFAAACFWVAEKEPSYHGKKLSDWVDDSNNPEAEAAFRAMGTNAIPILLKWIRMNRPEWRIKLEGSLQRVPLVGRWGEHDGNHRRWLQLNAPYGFKKLGPIASPAMPELVRLFINDTNSSNAGESAGEALAYLASVFPEVHTLFRESLTNQDYALRGRALNACILVEGDRREFLPGIMLALEDTVYSVRWQATNALRRIAQEVWKTNSLKHL